MIHQPTSLPTQHYTSLERPVRQKNLLRMRVCWALFRNYNRNCAESEVSGTVEELKPLFFRNISKLVIGW